MRCAESARSAAAAAEKEHVNLVHKTQELESQLKARDENHAREVGSLLDNLATSEHAIETLSAQLLQLEESEASLQASVSRCSEAIVDAQLKNGNLSEENFLLHKLVMYYAQHMHSFAPNLVIDVNDRETINNLHLAEEPKKPKGIFTGLQKEFQKFVVPPKTRRSGSKTGRRWSVGKVVREGRSREGGPSMGSMPSMPELREECVLASPLDEVARFEV
ncbi:MAG: hypothetical protein KVP17_002606 [Porospora cf. gigantea B]|nr:MAG: hypothetical protein KVP17_002606 [Porospora cf. gigantea B]